MLRILQVNKFYYLKGGSESCLFTTIRILKDAGHEVSAFAMSHPQNLPSENADLFVENVDYNDLQKYSLAEKLKFGLKLIYSLEARKKMTQVLDRFKPHIVHCHNIYHQLSPSILAPARTRGIPIVLTLHDFKLACPNTEFYTEDAPCERCSRINLLPALRHKCTKHSTIQTALAIAETYIHRILRIYERNVDVFISPSRFLKQKLVERGWPANRFAVVPNFIDVAEVEPNYESRDYILYLGRMLIRKGVMTLIRAMKANRNRNLKIAGVGPDLDAAKALAARERLNNIEFTGFLSGNELQEAISGALAIVVPSELYENCPMSILEAFAHGKPVIGSHVGGIPEQITHGENGYLFPPADSVRLGELIDSMFGNRDLARKMGMEARKTVETKYSAERHYTLLLEIYNRLLAERA